ncbi:hypothetical protein [Haloarcula japonica]|uniref:hypothetical protein n=1 Tax=Haloarcula japonica TaxID=29282 RepID=UPI0012681D2D|nr:hypothetical protein [Haloarcula japonica]
MTSEESEADDESYCRSCGELLSSTVNHCTECGAEQAVDTDASVNTEPASGGFSTWAIGFVPGSTLRNILVAFVYFIFYFVGVPLLLYAYWSRGGKYKKRTYYILGAIGISFVAIVILGAVIGAAVGPVGDTSPSQDVEPTPTVEPSPEFSVRISYSGSWQGALSVTGGRSGQSESISGSGTESIEITGDVRIISVNAQKQDDSSSEIIVQILNNGEVVSQASTSSAYGVAQTSQSF